MKIEEDINQIKESIFKEKKTAKELGYMLNYIENIKDEKEKKMVENQTAMLQNSLKKTGEDLVKLLEEGTSVIKPLESKEEIIPSIPITSIKEAQIEKIPMKKTGANPKKDITGLEKEILKRLKKKKEKEVKKKEKKPSVYAGIANNLFAGYVKSLIKEKKKLESLEKDLIKSNLGYSASSYISVLILTTVISFIIAIIIFVFFLFFDLSPVMPVISPTTDSVGIRFLKIFWLIFVIPLGTFLFMYFYPSLEKKSAEGKIDIEVPFAAIHMAAISGSMIEPTKIFSIISATGEYPNIEKEFNKLLNEINVYGYDLVTALKDVALNCPSQKLAELFNGLATTITSGGDLFDFFDKRSQSLLFDYKLDKEKQTKSSETFMDIYISVVIAAPMIFMLLLMMMKISGLGISISTSMITFLVAGGVALINIVFLVFLQLKQPATA